MFAETSKLRQVRQVLQNNSGPCIGTKLKHKIGDLSVIYLIIGLLERQH